VPRRSPPSAALVAALIASGCAVLPSPAAADATARMQRALNHARTAHGLPQLRPAPPLMRASGSYAHRLARTSRFQHAGNFQASGFDRVGEILGVASPGCSSRMVVRAWLGSPVHRRLLLTRSYRYVGIGKASGRLNGHRMRFWVVRLGTR
jgi:uncharacterized protein YkwD